jgi:hypothetical protein
MDVTSMPLFFLRGGKHQHKFWGMGGYSRRPYKTMRPASCQYFGSDFELNLRSSLSKSYDEYQGNYIALPASSGHRHA